MSSTERAPAAPPLRGLVTNEELRTQLLAEASRLRSLARDLDRRRQLEPDHYERARLIGVERVPSALTWHDELWHAADYLRNAAYAIERELHVDRRGS